MIHNMKLHDKPFNLIKNGSKTIEMRLYDEKRQKINIGDTIIFSNSMGSLKTEVINIYRFKSFYELYNNFIRKLLDMRTMKFLIQKI